MPRSIAKYPLDCKLSPGLVGVGLRHPHFQDAMGGASQIDFIEVHAENFFDQRALNVLQTIAMQYPVSLHATSIGLGSAVGINERYLMALESLVKEVNPAMVSDHACFAWSHVNGFPIHAGDLLPLEFTKVSVDVMVENVDRVQQCLGRQILIENLSTYLPMNHSTLSEAEFLVSIADRTQCGLLIDLNNVLVNLHNQQVEDVSTHAKQWLKQIPQNLIREFHLAGYSEPSSSGLIVDDHSQPVNSECWSFYEYALTHTGPVPTLIEWDNDLPSWEELVAEAAKAKHLMESVAGVPQQTQHEGSKYEESQYEY